MPAAGAASTTHALSGLATWYGSGLHAGRTASGEFFDMHAFTAAHRSLPFGTRLQVTNLRNDRTVHVRVNDRGPYRHGAILDLSYAAAKAIGLDRRGMDPVMLQVLSPDPTPSIANDSHNSASRRSSGAHEPSS